MTAGRGGWALRRINLDPLRREVIAPGDEQLNGKTGTFMLVLRPPVFDLHMSVAIVRAGQLGALAKAVELLEHGIRELFEAADTGAL